MVNLLSAAEKSGDWYDPSVTKAIVGTIGAIIVALIGLIGKGVIKLPRQREKKPAPDLSTAAAAYVRALGTPGPAQRERLDQSRADLEAVARALGKGRRIGRRRRSAVRERVLQLANCTDAHKAAELKKQLDDAAHDAR